MEYDTLMSTSILPDCSDEGYLRHLSLYATVRADDIQGITVINNLPSSKRLTRKAGYQSLQDIFAATPSCQTCSPDQQGVPVIGEESTSSSSESLNEQTTGKSVVVRGEDVQDLPVEYNFKEIYDHEFPVIGLYIDRRICPGFRYRVRYPGSQTCAFDGEARVLMSIGMGYGKRLTFKGDRLNNNDHYFWSDSREEGFAFSLQVLKKGDTFVLYDEMAQPVGDVLVENTDSPQIEESMEANKGNVQKSVRVRFACTVIYHHRFHGGLVEMNNQDIEIVDGLAEVVKSRNEKEAKVICIKNALVTRVGKCTLWKE